MAILHKFYCTIKSEWSVLYIEGLQAMFFSLKIDRIIADHVDPECFNWVFTVLQNYPFRAFSIIKDNEGT